MLAERLQAKFGRDFHTDGKKEYLTDGVPFDPPRLHLGDRGGDSYRNSKQGYVKSIHSPSIVMSTADRGSIPTVRSKIVFIAALSSIVNGLEFPIGITNCGIQSWIQSPPKRAVTMNQGTTEIMLALGLAEHMVGTAYLDDFIWSELEAEYKMIPVIAKEYPTINELLSVEPDFVYASYSSAFATTSVNYTQGLPIEILGEDGQCDLVTEESLEKDGSHCRAELHKAGIQTYLQKPACELIEHRPAGGAADTITTLMNEIWDIAR
jgi:hypothetical protein